MCERLLRQSVCLHSQSPPQKLCVDDESLHSLKDDAKLILFDSITSDIEKKIEAAEMWFIRRMLRISWTEKKTNVNVLREGNVQRSLLKTIRKRQMEFLGHVCRRRGLEFLSLTGKVEGKRDRGKQRITFLDSLCNSATGGQSKG